MIENLALDSRFHSSRNVAVGRFFLLLVEGKDRMPDLFSVKALSDDGTRIGGYVIVFGSAAAPDLTGDYFTPQTDLCLDLFPVRPVFYDHGLDSAIKTAPVGVIDTLRADSVGVWCEAQLDRHHRYLAAIQQLIGKGALGWSSGSLPHLVQKRTDPIDPHSTAIVRWPLIEASLTPTPAQPYHTSVGAVKSAYAALGLNVEPLSLPVEVNEEIALDEIKTLTQTVSSLTDAVKSLQLQQSGLPIKRLPVAMNAMADTSPRATQITVTRATKYSELSAADMSFMCDVLAAREWRPDEAFYRELADKSVKAVNAGQLPYDAIKGLVDRGYLKTQELDNSGQTGYGAEWVADSWRAELWLRVRQDNVVAPLFSMIEMPTNPYELPIESADPIVYYVSETTDQGQMVLTSSNPIPETKVASTKITMRAQKLALRIAWSSELNEDSLIPIVANYRRQAIRAMQNAIDNVLINGDTTVTANANVNAIDGTPIGASKYLAFNGLRKYALVTNAAQSYNAGGPITLPLLRKGRFLLNGAYALRPRDCAWIVDDLTYAKMLGMPEFVTMDKAGAAATNLSGQVGLIDGVPVFASAELGLSQAADGKISGTPANNTRGTALCVFKPLLYLGFKRQVTANLEYISYADIFHLVVTARLTMAVQDNVSIAALFNLAV